MNKDRRSNPDEEWVPTDDRVIGTAFRYSLILLLALAALITTGAWLYTNRAPQPPASEAHVEIPTSLPSQKTVAPPDLHFTDITDEAGIDFVHENGAYGRKFLPETMGGGAAFSDLDNDGDPDLLLVNGNLWPWHEYPEGRDAPVQHLYLNDGDGNFTNATSGSGLDKSFYGTAPAIGDFDGDGREDIFIAAVGRNRLFRNLGNGQFREVTSTAGVAGGSDEWSSCAAFLDIDADGDLDLFVCNYVDWSREIDLEVDYRLTGIGRAYGPPNNYAGTHSRLYRNNGDGTFSDISAEAGIQVTNPETGRQEGKALAVLPTYINDDRRPDLIVANDTVRNFVFINQGGIFEERGIETGLAFDPAGHATGAMGIDTALVDRPEQRQAVAIGNFSGEMTSFYLSQGQSLFADQSATSGIGPSSRLALSFGVFFFDADLDGRPDLFQTNGHLEQEINSVQPGQHYAQPSQLFWNCGSECPRRFIAAGTGDIHQPLVGRAAAYTDIDGDGDLDILITQVAKTPILLRNDQQTTNNWLQVSLRQSHDNTRAIGATVRLESDSFTQERHMFPTRGYQSHMPPVAYFGLDDDPQTSISFTVIWPDGSRTTKNIFRVNRSFITRRTN